MISPLQKVKLSGTTRVGLRSKLIVKLLKSVVLQGEESGLPSKVNVTDPSKISDSDGK